MSPPPPKRPGEDLERRLRLEHRLPSLLVISLVFAALAAAGLIAWPAWSPRGQEALTGGAVSNHHRLIEAKCERCHEIPFRGASDERCRDCHHVEDHAASLSQVLQSHPQLGAHCADCHKEHHGQRSLVPTDSPLCTRCHSAIRTLLPSTKEPPVADFDHHPELSARIQFAPGRWRRVRLDSPEARDGTPFKFSHAEHLAAHPGRYGDGRDRALDCKDCHSPDASGAGMAPIRFVRHCQRCHLADLTIGGVRVPHGDPDAAFRALFAGLASRRLGLRPQVASPDAGAKSADGEGDDLEGAGADSSSDSPMDSAKSAILAEARGLETALFTEPTAGCARCHDVVPAKSGPARYAVVAPRLPVRFLYAARFSHAAHAQDKCRSCHRGAAESRSASDLLLPRIARCRECHADPGTPGKIESPCLQCHGYHGARAKD